MKTMQQTSNNNNCSLKLLHSEWKPKKLRNNLKWSEIIREIWKQWKNAICLIVGNCLPGCGPQIQTHPVHLIFQYSDIISQSTEIHQRHSFIHERRKDLGDWGRVWIMVSWLFIKGIVTLINILTLHHAKPTQKTILLNCLTMRIFILLSNFLFAFNWQELRYSDMLWLL